MGVKEFIRQSIEQLLDRKKYGKIIEEKWLPEEGAPAYIIATGTHITSRVDGRVLDNILKDTGLKFSELAVYNKDHFDAYRRIAQAYIKGEFEITRPVKINDRMALLPVDNKILQGIEKSIREFGVGDFEGEIHSRISYAEQTSELTPEKRALNYLLDFTLWKISPFSSREYVGIGIVKREKRFNINGLPNINTTFIMNKYWIRDMDDRDDKVSKSSGQERVIISISHHYASKE